MPEDSKLFGAKKTFGRRKVTPGIHDTSTSETEVKRNTSQSESLKHLKSIIGKFSENVTSQNGSILSNNNFLNAVRKFVTTDISNAMLYTDKNNEHFSLFGQRTQTGTVEYVQHEILYFLVNNILLMQMSPQQNASPTQFDNHIELLALKITLNSSYLNEYIGVLDTCVCNNIFLKLMKQEVGASETYNEIIQLAQGRYELTISHLAKTNNFYRDSLKSMVETNTLPQLPVHPLVMGHIKNQEAVLLNIYMSNEMGQQMKSWLATQQAKGMIRQ